ncbi:MAG TPA: DNA primase catalytic subunit PriS [Thermoplasmata archaeon]|jgi:DNA primase small subunit|nr:DNA primase catalytic subunit PriS [Thermoplasmata archaeon]
MGKEAPTPEVLQARVRTTDWVKERLRRHYANVTILMPDRFPRREFGFMFWGPGTMQRHAGFTAAKELRDFLVARVPAHVYHSSAYYERPDAPTMEEKGWLGADLIFDLDADHIPRSREMTYEEMLDAVKRKIVQLHDDFLVADFGFDERSLRIVFSGGRGYHIHVHDERVWALGSHERREIVDYITGKELDVQGFFRESPFDVKEFRGHARVKTMVVTPRTGDAGWGGKISRGIVNLANRLEQMPPEQAVEFLAGFEGVGAGGASELHENLFKARGPNRVRGIDRLREGGNLETLTDRNRDRILAVVTQLQQVRVDTFGPLELEGIRARAETDEPVTSDIKRLIRLPSSVHGKSGLEVVPLTRDALDGFRPLRDAVPVAYTDEPVSMRLAHPVNINLRDETFNLTPGIVTLPEFAAVFLACRQEATVS